MNYFIDFEATQFSNGIISVGCVSERGDEFYSLVHTSHKITPFITDLTGITQKDIDEAKSQEYVFSGLFHWIERRQKENDGSGPPHFYCYGNCDKEFVKNNFKECRGFLSRAMLGYLYTDLEDYSTQVKIHFGLCKNIALKKVYGYCVKEEIVQSHNPVEDAKMLKVVYEHIQQNPCEFDVFPEYARQQLDQIIKVDLKETDNKSYAVCRMKADKIIETYPSLEAAVRWGYYQIPKGAERDKTNVATIARRIKSAARNNKKYRNFKWIIVEKN